MSSGSLLKTQKSCDHLLRSQRMLRVAKKLKENGLRVFFFSCLKKKKKKEQSRLASEEVEIVDTTMCG